MFLLGVILHNDRTGQLGTTGWQMLVWGFCHLHGGLLAWHLHHQLAVPRLRSPALSSTGDTSRNNWLLAILTLGEGWHNNHHYYPNTVRQGFYWWEYDLTYYLLRVLSWFGIIWDLKPVPVTVRENPARRLRR